MIILKKWKKFLRHKTDEFFIDRQNMNDAVHQESGSRQVSVVEVLNVITVLNVIKS